MKSVPDSSSASAVSGLWFVFQNEGHKIALWTSALTGREEVYLDGSLVSASRKIRFNSSHVFVEGLATYTVAIVTRNLRQGALECTLAVEGKILAGYVTKCESRWSFVWQVVMACAIGVAFLATYEIPLSSWAQVFSQFVIAGSSFALVAFGSTFVVKPMQIDVLKAA